jgi:hypothetical protein
MSMLRIRWCALRACISEARAPFAHEVEAVASSAWAEIFAWHEAMPWSDVPIGSLGYRRSMAVAQVALEGEAHVIKDVAA